MRLRSLVLLLSVWAGALAPAHAQTGVGDRVTGAPWASRSAVLATHGVAATSQPLATQIAIDVLKAGGSAVDAAIAANAALGLMEPTGCGVGGDLFAIVWDPASARLYGLNGSGRSAASLDLAGLRARIGDVEEMPNWGSIPVTVPGTVDAWHELHQRFGRRPWADLFAPAIGYAREGFPVSQVIAYYLGRYQDIFTRLHAAGEIEEIDNYRATHLVDGKAMVEGQVFRNPDLADTYQTIAEGGRDAFYIGRIARTIDAYLRRIDGFLTADDFAAHRSEWVDPVSVSYRGYELFELPPNGQGVAALQMLKILEGFDLAAMGHNSADYLHVQAEAKKLVFEDRARFYADPGFFEPPLEWLLSDAYATQRRTRIDLTRAARQIDPGDPRLIDGDTIYLCVADADGMMVSLIQSNYRGMGSGLIPDGLGFMLQDRGALFSLDPNHPNAYAPSKRPFHTIIPAFLMQDGEPVMAFGLMGGAMQPQGHVQIVCNLVDFGMGLQEAGDAARYHHKGSTEPTRDDRMLDGGVLEVESGVDADVIEELRRRGHTVEVTTGPFGGYQAVWRDRATGVYWGASEMRKDGQAGGY